MLSPTSLFSLFLLATSIRAGQDLQKKATSANPDSSAGTLLYVTEPACGSFRCVVTWPLGSKATVNWVNPPEGNVSIALSSNTGGATYSIVDSYPAISQEGYCDSGSGVGVVNPGVECGQVQFDVPLGWAEAVNYTIVVTSLSNPDLVGYTDAISLVASNSSSDPAAPSGTVVSLITIPSPTSTNLGASTQFSASLPAPTAVTGEVTSSTSAAATSAKSSASGTGSSSAKSGSSTGTTTSAAKSSGTSSAAATATSSTSAGMKNTVVGIVGLATLGFAMMVVA